MAVASPPATKTEYRCPRCDRLLLVAAFVGEVQAKCAKCKRKVTFRA